jgi:hypothetical protein
MSRKLQFYTAARPRRAQPEARLQSAVCQVLLLAGVPDLIWFAVPNGLVSDPRTVAAMKGRGLRPGVADLCIVTPGGHAHFLELKTPGSKQSREQFAFGVDCAGNGAPYAVSDNIEFAIRMLIKWNAIDAQMCGRWGQMKSAGAQREAA